MKIPLLLSLTLLLSTLSFAQTNYPPETLAKIKEVENNITGNLLLNNERPSTIAERMKKYNVKGLSIAVIYNYKIVWAKGYGWADEAEKRPVTTETLFEPGSISKTLNSVGILKLAQDKKLDLNTDINTYLTSWKFPYDSLSGGKKITLADILSHNAGLTVHGFPGHDMKGPIPSIYQVLDGKEPSFTPAVRSMYAPGLKFEYSGGGTSISQVILTDITKKSYDEWMYDNVLKPIGMVNSSYAQPPAKDKWKICASGYNNDGTRVSNKFHVYPEQAAAGLWMTPSDLCNYVIDMQMALKGQPSKVLSAEMLKLHLTPYNNGPAAMGTFIEDHDGFKYFEHSAGNDGFCGDFYGSMEDGYGVAVFMNTNYAPLLPEVINSVAKAYNWKNFYNEPKRRNTVKVADNIVKTYEGIYLFDGKWAAIGKKDGEFHFHTDGIYAKMYFSTPACFFNEEFAAVKEFLKDAKGNITGYSRTVDGKKFPEAIKVTNIDTLRLECNTMTEIGWYLLEVKKFKESLACFKRGAQLYPKDLNTLLNLAHLYLFNNEYAKAVEIYKAHLKEDVRPGYSFEKLMLDDYVYLRDKKFDVKKFDKVFSELSIKKPVTE